MNQNFSWTTKFDLVTVDPKPNQPFKSIYSSSIVLPPLKSPFSSRSCYPFFFYFYFFVLDVIGFYCLCIYYCFDVTTSRRWRYGEEHYEEEGNGELVNEGMPPSLIILILCFINCIEFYGYNMHVFNLIASASIDTLPWSACRLSIWHLSRSI